MERLYSTFSAGGLLIWNPRSASFEVASIPKVSNPYLVEKRTCHSKPRHSEQDSPASEMARCRVTRMWRKCSTRLVHAGGSAALAQTSHRYFDNTCISLPLPFLCSRFCVSGLRTRFACVVCGLAAICNEHVSTLRHSIRIR